MQHNISKIVDYESDNTQNNPRSGYSVMAADVSSWIGWDTLTELRSMAEWVSAYVVYRCEEVV
jgi:hypothetical protein